MRKTRGVGVGVTACWGAAVVLLCGSVVAGTGKGRTVAGESRTIGATRVSTWTVLDESGGIQEVGVTVPLTLVEHPPAEPGDGPAGAIATLKFPGSPDSGRFFDHFELHWNPKGHEPICFMKPPFDFHFYMVPEAVVRGIDRFVPDPPAPDGLPEGYIYAGEPAFHPQMGNHLFRPEVLQQPFSSVMIAGWNAGRIHFLEPMVTQELLLARRDFALDVPARPKALAGSLYPSYVRATYDPDLDAYRIVFGGFSSSQASD